MPRAEARTDLAIVEARKLAVAAFERSYLTALLEETRGQIGETAARAQINPKTLYEKMRAHGLRKEDFRPRQA
jgi:DNA-binding NtrC family response regulator